MKNFRSVKPMKDRECIHCERFFDCAGKPTDRPCILFKERKQERKNGFQRILEERGEKDGKAE